VALQHRGQESAGIVTSEGKCAKNFNVHKGMGMINNIFNDDSIRKLKGNLGIGHTRYSTSAASEEVNCQPFVVHTAHGVLAVAHNGELVNCESLRKDVSDHYFCRILISKINRLFSIDLFVLLKTYSLLTNFQVLSRGVGLSTHSDSELITQALCLNPPEGEVNFINTTTLFSHCLTIFIFH
jgi:amidophosphoribosyltransferase